MEWTWVGATTASRSHKQADCGLMEHTVKHSLLFCVMTKNEYTHFLKPCVNLCHPQWSTLEQKRVQHMSMMGKKVTTLLLMINLSTWGMWLKTRCLISTCLSVPESIQPPVWILRSRRQQFHSWVSWVIVAQVQISQMRRIWLQGWCQRNAALFCDPTTWKTAKTPTDTKVIPYYQHGFHGLNNYCTVHH